MSSSDEEAVRRPDRATSANGLQSPAPSDNDFGAENGGDGNQMVEDNDADLFGSEGSEGGFDNIEYVIFGTTDAQGADKVTSNAHRTLDDEQLDSGDDEDRFDRQEDRMDEAADGEDFGETVNIMDVGLARAPAPATNDDEV